MYHLPPYVALERLAAGKIVVVVGATDVAGPRYLARWGARVRLVAGRGVDDEFESYPGVPDLPFADGSVHFVACIEGYAGFAPALRERLLREAHRVLAPDGVCLTWGPHRRRPDPGEVDFFALERDLARVFPLVQMVAQIPWRGFSLAPVLDDVGGPSELSMGESLLTEAPTPTHYLGFGGNREAHRVLARVRSCLLVPLPAAEAEARLVQGEGAGEDLQARLAEAETARADLQARLTAAETAQMDLQARFSDVEAGRAEAVARLAEAHERFAEAEAQRTSAVAQAEQTRGALHEHEEALRQLRAEVQASRRELDDQSETSAAAVAELADARAELELARAELRSHGESQALQEQALSELRAQWDVSQEELAEARRNMRGLAEELDRARVRESTLGDELQRSQNALREAEARLVAVTAQHDELRRSHAEQQKLLQARETDVVVLGQTVGELEESLRQAAEQVARPADEQQVHDHSPPQLMLRLEALARERDEVARRLEGVTVERDTARARVVGLEQELEAARAALPEPAEPPWTGPTGPAVAGSGPQLAQASGDADHVQGEDEAMEGDDARSGTGG